MKFKMKLSTIFLFKIFLVLIIKTDSQSDNSDRTFTRIIMTSQGALQGTIIVPIKKHGFPRIERFLGIPYAKPPVKNLRFMPPGSPPPWKDQKICDRFGPVCPQLKPTLDKKSMSEARYKHLMQLLPYLERQSEDCLYLNIYAPENEHGVPQKNPVIVYIHGESFEWNSGNPYDGSILASYGKVVVVTLNFRLGILGFMKPGIKDTTPANFGLLDQIAALQWIQDNIAAFGGNPESVTLMGHGTGAACVNFLMVSPVARGAGQGLFHRAILMSGTALADWALTANFRQITTQVAAALNCPPTEDDNEMADCLKAKRLEDILNTQVVTPNFTTPFGPVIDGSVVPNKPSETMGVYTDLFSRYDLLCGVTELESYHLLNAVSLAFGMTEKDRDEMLRAYIAPRFEIFPDLVLTKTLDEYTDYTYQDHFRTSGYKHRDVILDILSDARVVAPLIQTASFHSAAISKTYFYVFKHNSIFSSFANVEQSVHGEEILFVFGIPLLGSKHPYSEPVNQEAMFAEAVMTYWTNFAKTGNPNYPRKVGNRQFDLTWPPYEKSKMHMNLSIPLALSKDYRQEYMKFWNEVLPAEMDDYLKNSIFNKPSKPKQPPPWLYPNVGTSTSWMNPPISYPKTGTSYNHDNIVGGVFHSTYPKQKYKVVDTTTPVYGTIKNKPPISDGPKRPPYISLDNLDNSSPTVQPETFSASFSIVIALGIVFLLINIIVFAALYYKRDRLNAKERTLKRKYEDSPLDDNNTDGKDDKRQKVEAGLDEKGCNVMKMMKSSRSDDVYEAVKLDEKTISQCSPKSSPKCKFTRKMSTSTIDPHTKVREWIAHEIVQRCSPRFLRKTRQQKENEQNKNSHPTKSNNKTNREPELRNQIAVRPTSPIYSGNDSGNQSMQSESSNPTKQTGIPVNKTGTLKKPKKVSVAIDATSDARSSSVLKQEPIELTKSLDYPKLKPFNTLPIRRSATLNDFLDNSQNNLRRSTTNINLQPMSIANPSEPSQSTVIKIDHSHSKSDPVQATYVKNPDGLYIYSSNQIPLKLQTFNGPDINVTCRDDSDVNIKELTPEEALQTIKRRKFPKVLPDFPENEAGSSYAQKRRSLPPPSNFSFMSVVNEDVSSYQNLPNNQKIYSRIPPAPPPRISSTLGRKPVNADPVVPMSQQSSSEEPTIVCNTIHVGSLIPQKESGNRRPVNLSHNDHKEPIYVSSKGHQQAKTIISASSNQPMRRTEPKVIIKPSIGKKCDITVTAKSIPRVMASETDPTRMNHGLFTKQNSQNEQGLLSRQNSQNEQRSLSRQNSQNEQRPLSRQNSQNEQRPLSRQNSQNEQRPLSRQNSQNEQRPISRQNSQNEQRPLSRQNSQNEQISLSRQNSQNEQSSFCRQNCEKTLTQHVQVTVGSGEQKPDQKSKAQKISFIPTLLKTTSNKSSSNSSNSTSDGSNSDTGTVKRILK